MPAKRRTTGRRYDLWNTLENSNVWSVLDKSGTNYGEMECAGDEFDLDNVKDEMSALVMILT